MKKRVGKTKKPGKTYYEKRNPGRPTAEFLRRSKAAKGAWETNKKNWGGDLGVAARKAAKKRAENKAKAEKAAKAKPVKKAVKAPVKKAPVKKVPVKKVPVKKVPVKKAPVNEEKSPIALKKAKIATTHTNTETKSPIALAAEKARAEAKKKPIKGDLYDVLGVED